MDSLFLILPAELLAWGLFGLGAVALGLVRGLGGRGGVAVLIAAGPLLALLAGGQALAHTAAAWWQSSLTLACLAGALTVVRFGQVEQALSLGKPASVQAVLLILTGCGALAWQYARLEGYAEAGTLPLSTELEQAVDLTPLDTLSGRTDAGNSVALYSAALPGLEEGASINDANLIHGYQLERQVIQTGEPDLTFNCHGWVFSGGKCWIRGSAINQILAENHYQPVARPAPGDVAVFRDTTGEVQHTALVRMVNSDGTILLESKWGLRGRYLHTASQHAYRHCTCTYYHTSRPTHVLRGLETVVVGHNSGT